MTGRIVYFTGIPTHVSILYIIKEIQNFQEYLRDDVVSKMIEGFNGRQILVRFNKNQSRDILQGF